MKPTILGINYIYHDTSACLLKDGEIQYAVEEERLSRRKHSQEFPARSIETCLAKTRTDPREINHVAISVKPGRTDALKLAHAAKLGDLSNNFMRYEFDRLHWRHIKFWDWFQRMWPEDGTTRPEIHFLEHHLTHGLGTFLVSPWDSAAILSLDGWGEWSTCWLGHANKQENSCLGESHFPHSLGVFYSTATEFCGFKPNYDEGKTMGLAPYGYASRFFDIVDSMVAVNDDGQIALDLEWFDFQRVGSNLYSEKFCRTFGNPRRDQQQFQSNHYDVAAAFQAVLEKSILKIARILRDKTSEDRLVYSGGVALNSVANGKILSEGVFKDIFLMPGAGDNGTAIGAAAVAHHRLQGGSGRVLHKTPFLGTEYSASEIRNTLTAAKLEFDEPPDITKVAAQYLGQGKIVGWFQGRMEFGPRALGNRSILVNPTMPKMKDRLNREVKHRESFRPFAPAVPVENTKDYFDIDVPVPFMLKVAAVRESMRSQIPAVVHVDGTARLQTVDHKANPLFHELLIEFGKQSGHPVLLNTSFNVMGEPIVESPTDALRCFFSNGMDVLIIGPCVLVKPATEQRKHPARSGC